MTGLRKPRIGRWLAVAGCVVLVGTATAVAQDRTERRGRGDRAGPEAREGPGFGRENADPGRWIMRRLLRDMDLSEKQQDQVREILRDAQQANREWQEKHESELGELRDTMRQAREDRDRDAMRQAGEKWRELREDAPDREETADKIRDVLTDEQRKLFDERAEQMRDRAWGFGGRMDPGEFMLRRLLRGVDLTDEQEKKIATVMEEAREEREAWRDENQDEIDELREQMRDAREDRDREAMRELGPEMRKLYEGAPKPDAALDTIRGVLTAEQQEVFDERREEMQERMERGRENWRERRGERGERRRERRDDDGE